MRKLPLFVLLLLSVALHAQDTNTLINQGVDAFKAGHPEQAAEFFRQAVALDPEQTRAHLYLGTAIATQVVPNLGTPDNLALATEAVGQFDIVLKANPDDLIALGQKASVLRNTDRPEEAKTVERTIEHLDPTDATAPYTIAVLDWLQAYKNAVGILAQDGLTDRGDGNPKKSQALCVALVAQNAAVLDDASTELTRAIELNPNYEEAMTYLSLVYRRRADLHCDSDPAINDQGISADLKQADHWAQESMAARKRNESRKVHNALSSPPQVESQPK